MAVMNNQALAPTKVAFSDYVKTTKMFFIEPAFEKEIAQEIEHSTQTLCSRMRGIFTAEGLEKYIRDNEDAIDTLISIMNISSEKFKRVVTLLRIQRGHSITGEWDLAKIRTMMLDQQYFMKEICLLLRNGVNEEKYKQIIPHFYLENFVIDSSTMARLSNPDDLKRLIKKGAEGRYNAGVGSAYFQAVVDAVNKICFDTAMTYSVKKEVPILRKTVDIAIPNEYAPRIVIKLSYNITTSSTQTRYREEAEEISVAIRNHNQANPNTPIIFVNVLDGAGWVGRQSDLRGIHTCTTFALHLNTINQLQSIIDYYC